MPINSWGPKRNCGDDPSECEPFKEVAFGTTPIVAGSDNCAKSLVAEEYPALVFASNDGKTALVSGSKKNPLHLSKLDKSLHPSVPSIVFQNATGDVKAWKPAAACYRRRVVVEPDSSFTLIEDLNPNVFENACIGTIDDVDYFAGAVIFQNCEGQDRIRLKFFPVSNLSEES